ncbi:MAG TPA: VpsF family polysaccharide biosynthesis protein [Xanthobacteraceae bacterium]|nr:VpsF family polysaccharide biosynthesis protein [Xanthobacteraceae bacterium]
MRLAGAYPSIENAWDARLFLRYLFALFWAFVLVRLIVNAHILDKAVNYSGEGGSIVEKIHPSTYGIALVLIATLLSTRIEFDDWGLRALRSLMTFALIIGGIATFTLLLGHTGSIGYLVDSYLVACAGGALMLCFPPSWRQWLGRTLLVFIAAGACVALAEFALQTRLLPYPLQELSFRPTGLSEHPLVLGLFNAVGINFVAATRWKAAAKAGVIVVMLLGTVAAGARIATLVAGLSTLSVIALQQWPSMPPETRFRMKAALLLAVLLAVPAVLAVLFQLGLLERFQNGLFDESAMARVSVYGLFGLASWSDILFGADIGRIRSLASEHFDLDFIESSIVMFVFQFGLIGTIIFLLFMARTFLILLAGAGRHVVIGTCAFFMVASANNGLSTKTPTVLMIVLLIVAFHGARPAPAVNSRR